MKKLASIISLSLLLSLSACCQYLDFPKIGQKQILTSVSYNGAVLSTNDVTFELDQEIVLEGISHVSTGTIHFRNDNGKLFYKKLNWSTQEYEDELLYDYSLDVGDRFVNNFYDQEDSVKVISKQKIINLVGDSVWQLELSYKKNSSTTGTLIWQEGIGDLKYGLFNKIYEGEGLLYSCTINEHNRRIHTYENNQYYCNCDYVYGTDQDNDGYANYTPRKREIFMDLNSIHDFKMKKCDTLELTVHDFIFEMIFFDHLQDQPNCMGEKFWPKYYEDAPGQYKKLIYYDFDDLEFLYSTNYCDNQAFHIWLQDCFENDCDDTDSSISPGNVEVPYNNIDDDCNSLTTDDDIDQDGFLVAQDCDDNNPNVNPNQTEIPYNGIDEDCNPATLDDDFDQDGFNIDQDCDDNNPGIFPGQTEIAFNGIDDDCNPLSSDNDSDQDGFDFDIDCDDNNPGVYPGQTENPYNGIDDDCNPATLDDDIDQDGFNFDQDCDDNNPDINPNQAEIPYNGIDEDCNPATLDDDLDQDGFNFDQDCDDDNPNINPNQTEIPYNGIDEDCNPATLDDDLDQDGFTFDQDCDDNNPDINPLAEEIANNDIDENCDGTDLISSNHTISNYNISIYPNPAINVIRISGTGQLNYSATLYNLQGMLVASYLNQKTIPVSFLPEGIYLLVIQDLDSENKVVEKVVVGR